MSLTAFLNLTARPTLTEAACREIRQAAAQITAWEQLPPQAEEQGLAPLLYRHLTTAQIEMPRPVKRTLHALMLRHRHANQTQLQTLAEVVTAFQQADIEVVLLKGAALAMLVYPEPGLRPMRDLDILVATHQARPAQQILADLGFTAPVPAANAPLPDKHMHPAVRETNGLQVHVEVHHNLFNDYHPESMTMAMRRSEPLPVVLEEGVTAHALGGEDMLWHLCQHVAYHANVWEPIRLVWVADIVGFAEKFVEQIDWARVAQHYPLVLNTLSLFHFITPLSETLQQRAALKIGRRPAGLGGEFTGWPRTSIANQREKGYPSILYDTFFPSEWWLRLHYGLNSAQPLHWYRWVRHPLHIVGRLHQLLRGK